MVRQNALKIRAVDGQAECLEDQMPGKCFLGWKVE